MGCSVFEWFEWFEFMMIAFVGFTQTKTLLRIFYLNWSQVASFKFD
ncbi:hypothetical protein VCR14J2_610311 [Vibrio coralliirubri]|nr:hypothetical protein VCR14J2_610311 [Vibrio coralliirubri]